MGRLVPFRPGARPRPGPVEPSASAEILVFTGVRYVREVERPRKKPAGTRRRGRRPAEAMP